ncbi:hypothetical protein F5X96DRAFT_108017 [Biscogniauxia mediterranea]|nr:hypothetical protein F5X96DRAFT_108017 [Biscogniauxia mediterranea]
MHLNLAHPLTALLLGGLGLGLPPAVRAASPKPSSKILLSEVQSLTLRAGRDTAHRRVPAIPQLRCVSAPAVCALHEVDVMRCTNQGPGYDTEDVQWSCSASLPPELKLGSTDVVCEGYANPDDPYVLKGSCGVEYRLVLTEEGERKFPDIANGGGGGGGWFGGGGGGREGGTDYSAWLFGVIFVGLCIWILYSAFFAAQENRHPPPGQRRPRNRWGGGGGGGFDPGFGPGGGGGGGYGGFQDDPPPPYPGSKPSSPSSSQGEGWRPGFWSGLAGGAAAGYLASRNNASSSRQEPRNYGSSWGSSSSSRSSPSGPSWGSGSRSTSAARHESTGFGSTSRR